MLSKPIGLRYQLLIVINLLLFTVLVLFGISLWVEWTNISEKYTEEIRYQTNKEANFRLTLGAMIYEQTLISHMEKMEHFASTLSYSEEFQILIQKSRISALQHMISSLVKGKSIDFVHVLDLDSELLASYPSEVNVQELSGRYAENKVLSQLTFPILSSYLRPKKKRVVSSFINMSPELITQLGLVRVTPQPETSPSDTSQSENTIPENEVALISVAVNYSVFGDPIGLLVVGTLVDNLSPNFEAIAKRTNLKFTVFTLLNPQYSTDRPDFSVLKNMRSGAISLPREQETNLFIQHNTDNLFCQLRNSFNNLLIGVSCVGMPISDANQYADRINAVLTILKKNISLRYLLLGTIALILCFLMINFLSIWIAKPLEIMTKALTKLARNDVNVELYKSTRILEIDSLSKATIIFRRNIIEMKRVQAELLEQKEEAELSNQVKSQFLGNMSHDLRTPLNAIIGFSEVMSKEFYGPLGDEKYKEYAKDIHFSGTHLLELISNILDVSSIESGKFTMNKTWFDLRKVIKKSVKIQQFSADRSTVKLNVEVDAAISKLYGDPLRIQQIINNLLSNAIKFTPIYGSVDIICYIGIDDCVIIKVIDTGVGIPDHSINSLFNPFFHSKNTDVTSERGVGLGLFLVKSFVESHGGNLNVESEEGVGSCFTLTFPSPINLQTEISAQ